jgi:outer membrane lipoprotein carrier protein
LKVETRRRDRRRTTYEDGVTMRWIVTTAWGCVAWWTFIVAVGTGPGLAAAQRPDADEILRRAERAYAQLTTLRAKFHQTLEIPALEQRREGRGTIYQKKPDFFLMKFDQPAGDFVLADGEHFWMYTPSTQTPQAIRTPMERTPEGADLHRQFVRGASERYVPTYVKADTLAGRRAHVIALVPKFDSPLTLVRVWIDAQDHLIRRFEMWEESGTRRTVELRDLEVGAPIADSLFRWTPPKGVQVVDR